MSRISGLADLRKKAEEDEKSQEFFAGGLDQRGGGSGLAVLGPPPSSSRVGSGGAFDNILQRASDPNQMDGFSSENDPSDRQTIITMYRNGFTVDDGPLRDLTSPENRSFLASLERGQAPEELRVGDGKEVNVALNDKRSEDYVPPPAPAYIAFSGTAATLGGSASAAGSGAAVFTEEMLSGVQVPAVDESAPVTTLQIKTVQGKKIKIKINQSSTVLQLAAQIVREGGVAARFALSSGFPPKDVTNGEATIAEAGLLSAAVTQRTV